MWRVRVAGCPSLYVWMVGVPAGQQVFMYAAVVD